ncbi:hypothetical protein PENTCL1PPCAC_25401, partial [Pristionchus entomophagus]
MSDKPSCVSWVRNGFCNNMAYTLAMRQVSCGIACGLCTSGGQPISPGVCAADANAKCAKWAANGFCTNAAYSEQTRQAYCCKTCALAPLKPTPAPSGSQSTMA